MSVVGISITRDEGDIVEESTRHMLAECDFVWIENRLSTDSTTDILDQLVGEYGDRLRVTTNEERACSLHDRLLAMTAETEAAWVVPFDTDEVWITNERLRDTLPNLDADCVEAMVYEHRPLARDTSASVLAAMRWRYVKPWAWTKVAVRPPVRFSIGHHEAVNGHRPLDGFEVRHFPWRTPTQAARRIARNAVADGTESEWHRRWYAAFHERQGMLDEWWEQIASDPNVVEDPVKLRCD